MKYWSAALFSTSNIRFYVVPLGCTEMETQEKHANKKNRGLFVNIIFDIKNKNNN